MAVIRKIRSYSGLLIAVIGIGLAAFVLGDFLGYGPIRGQRVDVGKIDGTSIPYQTFEQRVNDQMENWRQQTGRQTIEERDAFQIRQQVWNQMVREILLEKEKETLGLGVSREELYDLIHGPEPHPMIVQSFTDPATGQYDPEQVISFLRNFDHLEPGVRRQWVMLEDFLRQDRNETKYNNLIGKGYYVPDMLAGIDYQNRNATADIRFITKRYQEVDDTQITVSDRELRRTYDEHKATFEQEAIRSLGYVAFPVFATDSDREALRNELEEYREEFAETENVEAFVNSLSDRRFDPTYYRKEELSPEIDSVMFNSPVGTIYGPYVEGEAYVLAKLADVQMRPDSMRASHILIAYTGSQAATPQTTRSYQQALQTADSLLNVVRNNPARFGQLAIEFSDDPSAAMNQGDLEWFRDGDMVPEFNEAVVEGRVGSFEKVETDFGFHVIHITDKAPATRKVQVAKLTRDIEPSSRTYQEVYSQASRFASTLREKRDFNETADEKGVSVRTVDNLKEMDFSIPGIQNPRQIIQWAFDPDTRVGNYSRIYDIDDRFIIAKLTEKRDAGIPSLDEIRDEIKEIAIREKKFEKIAQEMQQALAEGNLDQAAEALELTVQEANDVRFNMTSLPGAGREPMVIGSVFAMEANTISRPIKGNAGVFVVEVVSKEEATMPEDLTAARERLQNDFKNRVRTQVFEAIKDNARVEDNRSMFY